MKPDVRSLSQDLAREGFAVFPALDDGTPACPNPFIYASTNLPRIAWLWQPWPGPLIGFATGPRSGVLVLELDLKHPEATAWWQANAPRLLPTRVYETRNGLSLYFRAGDGIGCSGGRICRGIDTKGEGGYAIHWPAACFELLDHSPPAPWPAWLRDALSATAPPLAGGGHGN